MSGEKIYGFLRDALGGKRGGLFVRNKKNQGPPDFWWALGGLTKNDNRGLMLDRGRLLLKGVAIPLFLPLDPRHRCRHKTGR